jgi:hypothetical protein
VEREYSYLGNGPAASALSLHGMTAEPQQNMPAPTDALLRRGDVRARQRSRGPAHLSRTSRGKGKGQQVMRRAASRRRGGRTGSELRSEKVVRQVETMVMTTLLMLLHPWKEMMTAWPGRERSVCLL